MSPINLTTPVGWNKWIYARNFFGNVQIPDAPFPYSYIPSKGFWADSIINNCLIPWLNVPSAMDVFLLAGGGTGSLAASVSALSSVGQTFQLSTHSQIFGVGRGAESPSMGFCIGNKFKQQVYTRLDIQNDGLGHTIATNASIDLLQNSIFKRAYVNHGSVVGYSESSSIVSGVTTPEYLLRLDINKSTPPPTDLNVIGTMITIIKQPDSMVGSETFSVAVVGIKENWDLIINKPFMNIDPGDFYKLNCTWCIEDPYLLSGFWGGSENVLSPPISSSGLNLYVTSHNSPFQKGKFLGVYIWQQDTSSSGTSGVSGFTSESLLQPPSGYSMNDSGGNTWGFLGFGNSNKDRKSVV